jgi:hypothetical protein
MLATCSSGPIRTAVAPTITCPARSISAETVTPPSLCVSPLEPRGRTGIPGQGANAVIGVDIDYETIGDTMLMVTACGTAVRV